MTRAVLQSVVVSDVCARCHGRMEITKNAVGIERYRCPRCDGIARRVTVHPDDPQIPQGLVRATATLPLIAPGQLRCQRCANGVKGNGRLCPACVSGSKRTAARTRIARGCTVYPPKPCANCHRDFQPTGPASKYCDPCLTPEQRRHRDSKRKLAAARADHPNDLGACHS